MSGTITLILLISFLASLVRSTLGFGESLIAVPLFLLFLPIGIAVPLSVMISIVIALVVVIQDHTKIHFKSAKWLVLYALLGIPFGVLVLLYGNETWVKIILGLVIILYALFSLLHKSRFEVRQNSKLLLFLCGFISGVLGGAYGLNGPALVVYGNLKKWTAKHFRATLQAYFLPTSFIAAVAYYVKGLITAEVGNYFLLSLISVIPAIFLGRYLNHKLNNESFFKYVYLGLILIGLMLVVQW